MKNIVFIIVFLVSLFGFSRANEKVKLSDSLNILLNEAFYNVDITSNIDLALEKMLLAEKLSKEHPGQNTDFLKAMTHLVRASSLFYIRNYEESKVHIKKGLVFGKKLQSRMIVSYLYSIKGLIYFEEDELDDGYKFLDLALKEANKKPAEIDGQITAMDFDVHKIDLYYGLAHNRFKPFSLHRNTKSKLSKSKIHSSLRESIYYSKKVLYLVKKTNKRKSRMANQYLNIAESYTELGDLELAKKYLDTCSIVIDSNKKFYTSRLHSIYGTYYQKINEPNQSMASFDLAYRLSRIHTKEELHDFGDRVTNEMEYLTSALKGDLLQTEIDLKKSERFKNIVTLSLIVILMLSLTAFLVLQRRLICMKSKSNQALTNSNYELNAIIEHNKMLEHKIENIQDVLARDLHDNFGNRLAGINSSANILMELNKEENYNPKLNEKFYNHLIHGISHLNSDVKDLIWASNSKNNLLSEVVLRLEQFSIGINSVGKCNIIYCKEIEEDYLLPRLWNRQILLIFKEAINNAVKHANAKNVELIIKSTNGTINICCKDDGAGFDLANVVRVSGVRHMRERAQSIDCILDIISSQNQGCEIKLSGVVEKANSYRKVV